MSGQGREEKGLFPKGMILACVILFLLGIGCVGMNLAAEEISEEKMPVILDEAFAYFDDYRLENALKFLVEELEENQIILFTCTKREEEILNRLNIKYNLIEL